jgi:outer membrane lipoprotein SlyB
MKKFLATFITIALMAVMMPLMANAQTKRYYKNRTYKAQTYQRPSVYKRHRNLINVGVGTGVGALIGAIAGGKKGAAIGALVGGGGAAVYSYGIKPKKRTYYRRY